MQISYKNSLKTFTIRPMNWVTEDRVHKKKWNVLLFGLNVRL